MTTSQVSPKSNGNGTQHSEQDAHLHSMMTDEESFKILFLLFVELLKNTYSPDVIEMSMARAKTLGYTMGFEATKIDKIVEMSLQFWKHNQIFGDMF